MTSSSRDYEVGYKRPPEATRWRKGQSGNPARRGRPRDVGALEVLDRLLLRQIEIVEKGIARKVPILEVIILQLWQQELAGNRPALDVRLKFERIAREHATRGVAVEFSENDYTRALANDEAVPDADHE